MVNNQLRFTSCGMNPGDRPPQREENQEDRAAGWCGESSQWKDSPKMGRKGRTGETGRWRNEKRHNRDRCHLKSRNVRLDERTEVEGGMKGAHKQGSGE